MTTGTVKFFNENKGYGFIAPDGGGNDAFVHISAVERSGMRTLRQDQRVSYDLQEDRRGKMAAVNLKAAEDAEQAPPSARPERRGRRPRPNNWPGRSSEAPTFNSSSPAPTRRGTRRKRRRSTMCASVAAAPKPPGTRSPTSAAAQRAAAGRGSRTQGRRCRIDGRREG